MKKETYEFLRDEFSQVFLNIEDPRLADDVSNAIKELLPVPDPETGLVPCGCGGKARLTNNDLSDSYMTVIRCASCGIEAGYVGIDSTKATQKKAETRWNRAMGYKEDT